MKNLEIVQNADENGESKKSKVKSEEKGKSQQVRKKIDRNKEEQNKKNLNVDNKSFKKEYNLKNDKLSQLEREIERNWEILERDRNENNLKKI